MSSRRSNKFPWIREWRSTRETSRRWDINFGSAPLKRRRPHNARDNGKSVDPVAKRRNTRSRMNDKRTFVCCARRGQRPENGHTCPGSRSRKNDETASPSVGRARVAWPALEKQACSSLSRTNFSRYRGRIAHTPLFDRRRCLLTVSRQHAAGTPWFSRENVYLIFSRENVYLFFSRSLFEWEKIPFLCTYDVRQKIVNIFFRLN